MNGRQAIEAMLQGKVVRTNQCQPGYNSWYKFDDGFCRHPDVKERGHDRGFQPSVFGGQGTYELYQEPNPHEPGTYAWAREEHARKNAVRNDCTGAVYTWGLSWSAYSFMDAEFETKTWRRA